MTYIGTIATGPSTSLTLDFQSLVSRVAALLQRDDLNSEIEQWINFVQRDMAKKIKFPSLRRSVETTLIASPATYYYDLPSDFSMPDRMYYRNTTDSANVWGRNLTPLPRKFYAGDVVDLERLLNVSVPDSGDPLYFWIDGDKIGIWPALGSNLTGTLQLTYYFLPPDLVTPTQEPSISNQYRHYIIWMAMLWSKSLLEKEDITKVAYWKSFYKDTIEDIRVMIRGNEVERETIDPPSNGLEDADEVF